MFLHVVHLPLIFLSAAVCCNVSAMHPDLTVNTERKYIEFPAVFHPRRFNRAIGLKNHHLITWEKGRAARKALFTTSVPDSVIHDGLVAIGAVPGNNLTEEVWSKRDSLQSPFPDRLVEGSPVSIEFIGDSLTYHINDFLSDRQGKRQDFRFGGNRALIPVWKSGCIVCLQSCPGAKIGNRTYSIRDLVNGRSSFSLNTPGAGRNKEIFRIRISLNPVTE